MGFCEWDADYDDGAEQSENGIIDGEDESAQKKPEIIS